MHAETESVEGGVEGPKGSAAGRDKAKAAQNRPGERMEGPKGSAAGRDAVVARLRIRLSACENPGAPYSAVPLFDAGRSSLRRRRGLRGGGGRRGSGRRACAP